MKNTYGEFNIMTSGGDLRNKFRTRNISGHLRKIKIKNLHEPAKTVDRIWCVKLTCYHKNSALLYYISYYR